MVRWPFILFLLVAATSAAHAEGDSLVERIDLTGRPTTTSALRVTQSITEPMATAGPLSPQEALRGERPDSARQTMFWADHARTGLGFGLGVEQRGPYSLQQQGQPQMNAGMLMGVSLATSARSRLTVQTPLWNAAQSNSNEALLSNDQRMLFDGPRQVRVGLTFNTKKPLSDLRQGVRMEINGQTTMAVKLRGGRLGFAFQKSW